MLPRPFLKTLSIALILGAITLTTGNATAQPKEPKLTSAAAQELWRKGADQILTGDFDAAIGTFRKVDLMEPGHSEITHVINWMEEAKLLEKNRDELRRKAYEHFVAEAKKMAKEAREAPLIAATQPATSQPAEKKKELGDPLDEEEGEAQLDDLGMNEDDEGYKWSRALDYAQRAMTNTLDEDSFRAEPWLQEIVEHSLVEIEKYKDTNEWREALVLYAILQEIYPKEQAYEDGYDYCRKRAHLDFVYGDPEKRDWEVALRDVNGDVVSEIIDRIDMDYVKDPDFKKLCTDGLEHLVLLAEAKSLRQTFPTLGDDDLVNNFVNRVNGLIRRRIEQTPNARFRGTSVERIFNQVLSINSDTLRLPESVLVDEFIAGVLDPLDEFTAVIWPAEVDEFNKHTRGSFVGVGIQITKPVGSHVRVESPLEDSPAYWAGIKPGDLITKVGEKSTLDMTINEAVREITGEPGTQVVLTIKDSLTDEVRPVTLTRARIKIRTVRGYDRDTDKPTGWDFFIDRENKIGYVGVTGFMDDTVDDLEQALKQLKSEGCRGLILDLRFNPGGLLTSAVDMCELFLGRNQPIVQTKGRNRAQNSKIISKYGQETGDMPMIVLVNEYSASASEIVAGALAGLKEACVIGTRTFGKGSVQNLIPIAEHQAYLKLTTAHYYIPDEDVPDHWYLLHREKDSETWGVEPHISVPLIPQEITKVLRLRRERDLLKGKDQNDIPREVLERRATSQPTHVQEDPDPKVDPQIATALDVMRIKLLSNQPWALAPRADRALQANAQGKVKTPKPN